MTYKVEENDVLLQTISVKMTIKELAMLVLGFGECEANDFKMACEKNGIPFDLNIPSTICDELTEILNECGVDIDD